MPVEVAADPLANATFSRVTDYVFNARRFFQVGPVQPAHENDYSGDLTAPLGSRVFLTLFGAQQKVRGNINGNVLVPLRPNANR